MKKITVFIALMCLVGLGLAAQYNDMIGQAYDIKEFPGRSSVYSESEVCNFVLNIPDEFEYAVVTPQNKLVKTFDFKANGIEGVMYLRIQNADGSWSKGREYPIIFKNNKFIVTEVSFDDIFQNGRDNVICDYTWEFKQGHNLIDHSPFAIKGVTFRVEIRRDGKVIPKGSPT